MSFSVQRTTRVTWSLHVYIIWFDRAKTVRDHPWRTSGKIVESTRASLSLQASIASSASILLKYKNERRVQVQNLVIAYCPVVWWNKDSGVCTISRLIKKQNDEHLRIQRANQNASWYNLAHNVYFCRMVLPVTILSRWIEGKFLKESMFQFLEER